MKINREQFLSVLKATAPAINDNSTSSALRYVCFRDNKAMATNLQLTIITPFEDLTGLLPHKLLSSILTVSSSQEIELTEDNLTWTLKCGDAIHKLGKSDLISNFPAEPIFKHENSINISTENIKAFKDAVKFSGVITSGVEGCYIGKDIVGTNGIIVYKQFLDANCELHVPTAFINALPNKGSELQYNNNFASIESDKTQIITNQLQTKYPKYELVFKDYYDWNVEINKADIETQIKMILAYEPTFPIADFEFTSDTAKCIYNDTNFEQNYEDDFSCISTYQSYVKLNVEQLSTILSCFNSDKIEMCITAHDKSVYIRELNNNITITLIQPVK